jgi:sugar O-acyltransferase (sialic acid O-acetyltransferase NeuD family)
MQIIGKGGFAREVAAYHGACKFFEYECEGIIESDRTVIAIGDPQARKRIVKEVPRLNYDTFFAGHFHAFAKFGKGCIICPGTVITVGVEIGDHVIINLNCTIGHDCRIGDFVTISPGAHISGNVTIGDLCYVGTGAVIREKISICAGATIGAGAVVVKNITEPGTYVGNPAKKIS